MKKQEADSPCSTSTLPTVASEAEFRQQQEQQQQQQQQQQGDNHNNHHRHHHHHHHFGEGEHPIHPFGEDDVNLWTSAVPTTTDIEIQMHVGGHTTTTTTTTTSGPATTTTSTSTTPHKEGDNNSLRSHHTTGSAATTQERECDESGEEDDVDDDVDKNAELSKTTKSWCPSCLRKAIELFKYVYSSALLVFCIVIVSAAIFTNQTTATSDFGIHPAVAFILFWFLLLWLAMMEGGLNCLVGLQPINKALYVASHPRAYKCTTQAHKGNNIERFIVGRQFLDLVCVFLTSIMVSSVDDAELLGLPPLAVEIFLDSGLAVILVTIVFGQLTTQINAAHSMLDFINNYAMIAITYMALFVEASGLLHAVYLIQILFSKFTGKPIDSKEEPRNTLRKVWFWGRVVMSTGILLLITVIIVMAIFAGETTMWEGVPPVASAFMLVILILLTGLMEGLQIAFFAVVHQDQELEKHRVARKNCQLVFKGKNLQTFLIGRQIFQTVVMFLIARITTVSTQEDGENLFGVSDGLQAFFNTGLMGALFSAIIASLAWRVLASSFPMAFLSNPAASLIIHICLLIELSGVCYSAWLVAAVNKRAVGYQLDEVYIGAAADDLDAAAAEVHDLQMMEEAEGKEHNNEATVADPTENE